MEGPQVKIRFPLVVQRRIPTLTEDMRLYHMSRRAVEHVERRALSRERWRVRLERWWRAVRKMRGLGT